MKSTTIATAALVITGAASLGTIARKVEHSDYDTAFLFSLIAVAIVGTVCAYKIVEKRMTRTVAHYKRPQL